MVKKLPAYSPFYAAYAPQSEEVNAAIIKAASESAAKMGDAFSSVYSIAPIKAEKLAA